MCYLMLKGDLSNYNLAIPSPYDENKTIDVSIIPQGKPKININIINGAPLINIDIKVSARLVYIDSIIEQDIVDNNVEPYQKICNYYVKQQLENFLYKTSKEYNSDLIGFGRYASMNFLTQKDFDSYNWLENYKNSFFKLNVSTQMHSYYL